MTEIISVNDVSKVYKITKKEPGLLAGIKNLFLKKFEEKVAVDHINFSIQEGEFVGFIGPNGAGKTTTIKMLSGIIHPSEGAINVMGYIPHRLEHSFKKNFSITMGQKNQLWWDLPAIDSFQLIKEIYEITEADYTRTLQELTELLEVQSILNTPLRNLSLGERMKFELIGALLHGPKVLFLDEPTIGLDVSSRRRIREFLKYINMEKKVTVILTSHYLEDIEELCNRIIAISHGNIIYDGTLHDMTTGERPINDIFESLFKMDGCTR
ncbi:ABC transporter ATP-binding protein [Paenibacillus tianjinensis]|uniref:ATP-binding cassette domain-containing protein n=1 Tax=Paenibacillus tianjinensis TaxID=2810347 RepID=A0ABX7LBS8_9BACL|nr:ATP-binding cassette domain-containing protein [Paenibacillus tianjinensis]QSF44248.1 ATP-binding cassette domain-containing protein [Paenibacillus tianjinensis]